MEDGKGKYRFKVPLDIDWSIPEKLGCPVEGYRHAAFTLRHPDDEKSDEIRALATDVEIDRDGKRTEVVDDDRFVAELFDYGCVDWDGLTDSEGKPVPCNSDTKLIFMRRHRKPATWAMRMITDGTEIAKAKMARLEAEKKISEDGCGQDSISQS